MKPVISVIVPVYNVEHYLHRCIDSLLNQSFNAYEIILVDDGSPDRCGEICDFYKENYENIIVVHKKNGGLSDARNSGVELASGEYISFVDSDDAVSPYYLEYLYKAITESDASMSFCTYFRFSDNDISFNGNKPKLEIETMSGKEACKRMITLNEHPEYVIACAKLIPTETALHNPFPVGMKHEDEAVTYRWYYELEKIAFVNGSLYAYYINPDGIMGSKTNTFNLDYYKAESERTEYFLKHGEHELACASSGASIRFLLKDSAFYKRRSEMYLKKEIRSGIEKRIVPAKVLAWTTVYFLSLRLYRFLYSKSSPRDPILNKQYN